MIKLVRKHFSTGKLHHEDQLLNWDLLRLLVEKQKSENFNLCNKLTHRHINWYQKPMNVRMAVETISNSVADVLEQLGRDGYEEFEDCGSTVEFLRIFNDAFDIFNFAIKDAQSCNIYKQHISDATVGMLFPFLERFKKYICELNINVTRNENDEAFLKPVLESSAKTGFFGFYIDAISLKGIYDEFVRNGPLQVFNTMQFSQDHIETFFSLVRNCQGRNDNPKTTEFRSAFRKLFVCHPYLTSADHNVISNATKILTASSAVSKRSTPAHSVPSEDPEMEVDYEGMVEYEIESMDPYDQHACAFIALKVEERMMKAMKCSDCVNVFAQSEKISDELLAMKKSKNAPASQPCESTLKIVIFSNAVMRTLPAYEHSKDIRRITQAIVSNLSSDDLYVTPHFERQQEGTNIHKENFITRVVTTYLALKSENIGCRLTDEECGVYIRNRMKTKVHASGQ